ncbi:serine/threonine protein kinase [Ktedonosporobacter rubrisoli]|nr:serine/threonine-protein kinase [Ktedonosporobacter rubrisoli]
MRLWRYGRAIESLGQRYHLEGALGSGGMADVCLAWDERDQREVAIKVIKPESLDQRNLDRFLKEAAQVAKWRHPHILRFYSDLKLELLDAAQGSIIPYIVMEYAQGGDLHKRLRPGQAYPLGLTLEIFEQLCSAVAYAHEQGLIHRDIKPLNVLFRVLADGSEQAVLSDFGLAVEMNATHHTFARGGTLAYMAPEQLKGRAQAASDIFALGVVLYQLCTGRLPFRRTLQDLRNLDAEQEPLPPSQLAPLLPTEVDSVLLTALAHEPARRFASSSDFWHMLQAALDSSTLQQQRFVYGESQPFDAAHPVNLRSTPAPELIPSAYVVEPVTDVPGPWDTEDDDKSLASEEQPGLPETPAAFRSVSAKKVEHGPASRPGTQQRAKTTPSRATATTTSQPAPAAQYVGIKPPARQTETLTRSERRKQRGQRYTGANRKPAGATQSSVTRTPGQASTALPGARRSRTRVFPGILLACGVVITTLIVVVSLNVFQLSLPLIGLLPGSSIVTITPDSRGVTGRYILTGVQGQPDVTQRQISTRTLTATASSQPKTVKASGHNQSPGTNATGQLTFLNGSFTISYTVSTNTPIAAGNISLYLDAPAVIPVATQTGGFGTTTVRAHAGTPGAAGNIPALTVNGTCCNASNNIVVKNTQPFTGGQDAKDYIFVQQSDINSAVDPATPQLNKQASDSLKQQLQKGEQLAGEPQCTPTVNSDHPAGDTGVNIPSVTVSITMTCKGQAYSQQQAHDLVKDLLQRKATTSYGPNYRLQGDIQMQIQFGGTSAGNVVLLEVNASGRWVYQFGDAQRQALLKQLTGKERNAAIALLKNTPGVSNAAIQLNDQTLPGDPARIKLVINDST